MKRVFLVCVLCVWGVSIEGMKKETRNLAEYRSPFGGKHLYSVVPYFIEDGKAYLIFGEHEYSDGTKALSGYVDIFFNVGDLEDPTGEGKDMTQGSFFAQIIPGTKAEDVRVRMMVRGQELSWVWIEVHKNDVSKIATSLKAVKKTYQLQAPIGYEVVSVDDFRETKYVEQKSGEFITYKIGGKDLTFLKDFVQPALNPKTQGEHEVEEWAKSLGSKKSTPFTQEPPVKTTSEPTPQKPIKKPEEITPTPPTPITPVVTPPEKQPLTIEQALEAFAQSLSQLAGKL